VIIGEDDGEVGSRLESLSVFTPHAAFHAGKVVFGAQIAVVFFFASCLLHLHDILAQAHLYAKLESSPSWRIISAL
jgi:hypothetical protein